MRLAEILKGLDDEHKREYASSPLWEAALSLSEEQGWEKALLDPVTVCRLRDVLPPLADQALRYMLQQFGAQPVPEEKLVKEICTTAALTGSECEEGLNSLQRAGLLYTVSKVWGERIWFMPPELFLLWSPLLFPRNARSIDDADRHACHAAERTSSLGRKLLYTLSILTKSDTLLVADGALSKKVIDKLKPVAITEERLLLPFGLQRIAGDRYPLGVALLLEAGSHLGLIGRRGQSLEVNGEALERWLALPAVEREGQLRAWLCALLLGAAGTGGHTAAALMALSRDIWYSSDCDSPVMGQTAVNPEGAYDGLPQAEEAWCRIFHAMGWMELALMEHHEAEEKGLLFRWLNDLDEEGEVIIQPDGEAIAYPDCSFRARWELERIAERTSDGDVAVYRLTSTSIAGAVERGMTCDSIIAALTAANGGESLPQSVHAMVNEWSGRACQYSFAEVMLLRCQSEDRAELAAAHPDIAPLLLQRIGPCDFLVRTADIAVIRQSLKKLGYPARRGISNLASEQEERTSAENAEMIFLHERDPIRHFRLAAPSAAQHAPRLLPGTERLPVMWWQQFRTYHLSTRKEMLEHAIQLKTSVELQVDEQVRSFIPHRLEEKREGWQVVGVLRDSGSREPVALQPEQWSGMKLVLPGGGKRI
ncbi:helicase-associated domain-containing protein [Paenibacillus sp. J5C_2022]|uniref:helicase-associated domain-containing protein n=1 Tax=Paenibacillus sp. J5C2022 TaxID=2977129 RepID=UPI0021D3CB01|nr:helicase-associated domain-containing protein [Paenibacillus sp. J5C2022]MCU6708971.1 helicase-associated domain-containing protein [Paenibacillus sp. J5C2022]